MEEVHEMFEFLTKHEFTVGKSFKVAFFICCIDLQNLSGKLWDYLRFFKCNRTTNKLYTFIYQRELEFDKELNETDSDDEEELDPPKKPRTVSKLQAALNDQPSSKSSSEATIPETLKKIKNEVPKNIQKHDSMEVDASISKVELQPTCSPGTSRPETNNFSPKAQKTKITDFFKKI